MPVFPLPNVIRKAQYFFFRPQALRRLRTSYIDVVQLYWNDYSDRGYVDAALFLQDFESKGLIRHVGLTNFDSKRVAEISDGGVRVLSNQVAPCVSLCCGVPRGEGGVKTT